MNCCVFADETELQGSVTGRVKNMRERVEGALQRTRQLDL
jgi:hypothetical protein